MYEKQQMVDAEGFVGSLADGANLALQLLVAPSPRYVRLLPSSLGVREGITCSLTAGRRNRDERAK